MLPSELILALFFLFLAILLILDIAMLVSLIRPGTSGG